jgi:hypothetical protein
MTNPLEAPFHTSDISAACPLSVRLRLAGKLDPEVTTALVRGSWADEALGRMHCPEGNASHTRWCGGHEVAEHVAAARVATLAKLEAEGRVLSEATARGLDEIQAEVLAVCERYHALLNQRFTSVGVRVVGVQVPIYAEIPHHAGGEPWVLSSHLDLVYAVDDGHGGETWYVWDWKWCDDAPVWHYTKRRPQMLAYWLGMRYGRILPYSNPLDAVSGWVRPGVWPEVSVVHLPYFKPYGRKATVRELDTMTGEETERVYLKGESRPLSAALFACNYSPANEAEALRLLGERVDLARGGHYPAIPGTGCQYCSSRRFCPSV